MPPESAQKTRPAFADRVFQFTIPLTADAGLADHYVTMMVAMLLDLDDAMLGMMHIVLDDADGFRLSGHTERERRNESSGGNDNEIAH